MGELSVFYTMARIKVSIYCLLIVFIGTGLADRLPYIFNGADVDYAGKYPWQASLQTGSGFHFCGGSLIGDKWVLTARHCTTGKRPGSIHVILGAHDVKTKKQGKPTRYTVSKVIEYPQCNSDRLSCDFSLLRLTKKVDMSSKFVSTIELPNHGEKFDKAKCVITGWGRLTDTNSSPGPRSPNVLQEIAVNVYTDKQCHAKVQRNGWPIICSKASYGGARPGDSGGPTACQVGSVWKLAGVASFIIGNNSFPNVYAEVADVTEWIQ